jgi:hypothetical protein
MGVRCKLLGHVRDSTEFEERQEERPNGTVLICREYQICRRCGDRKEMYRNEQVLTSEGDGADTLTEETTSDAGTGDDESESNQIGERDTAREPAEGLDTTGNDGREETGNDGREETGNADSVTDDAVVIPDSPAGEPSTGEPFHENETDDSLSVPVTDDAVVLSDSPTEAPSAGDTPGRTRPSGGDSSPSVSGDGGSRISADAGEDARETIGCTNCGREWRRDATSLREGDLCPGCREAYVEGV